MKKYLILLSFIITSIAYGTVQPVYISDIPYKNVKTFYGAKGNGITDDCPVLIKANINSHNRTLFFPAGTYVINANLTFDTTVGIKFENGAKLLPSSPYIITINGPNDCDVHEQCFDKSAGGNFIFGYKAASKVSPYWFGAKGDNVNDDTVAFQNTIQAAQSAGGGSVIEVPRGKYRITDTLVINFDYTKIKGENFNTTVFYFNPSSPKDLFDFEPSMVSQAINNSGIEGCGFEGSPSSSTVSKTAVHFNNGSHCYFKDNFVRYTWTGNSGSALTPSVGVHTTGHEFQQIFNSRIWADRPLWIDNSTVSVAAGSQFPCDHFHLQDLELYPQISTEAAIYITPGVLVTNPIIDGHESFIGGKYAIYFDEVASPVLNDPPTLNSVASTLPANTYSYGVTALKNTGESYSANTTLSQGRTYVTQVVPTSNTSTVTISWNAISGATGYRVRRETTGSPIWTQSSRYYDVGTATTFTDTGQNPTGEGATGKAAPDIQGYNWHFENIRREQAADDTGASFYFSSHSHFITMVNCQAAAGNSTGFYFRHAAWATLSNITYTGTGVALDLDGTTAGGDDRFNLQNSLLFGTQNLNCIVAHAAFSKRTDNQQAQQTYLGSCTIPEQSTILGNLGLGIDQPQPGGPGLPTYGLDVVGGGLRVRAIGTPAAPTVTPSITGSTTYVYTIVGKDRNGNFTVPGPSTTITNGSATLDATHYNTLTWTAIPGAASYDILIQDLNHYVTVNYAGTTYVDMHGATDVYNPPVRNGTGDLTVDGQFLIDQINVTNTIGVGRGSNGTLTLNRGDPTTTGYMSWTLANGTRLGYFGFSSANIPLNLENGATFQINGGKFAIGSGGTGIAKHVSVAVTWDPPSIVTGAFTTTAVTVTGATLGDTIISGFSIALPAGMILSAGVTSTNTVTATILNMSGGTVDLATGIIRVDIWQH